MKILRFIILVTSVLCLSGCGTIFMYMMGARGSAVPASQISSLYYKTSPDLKKAYVFYSIPGRIVTGMSETDGSVGEARAVTIEFGSVKDSKRNQEEFGEGIYSHYRIGDEWVAEFDIGDNDPAEPHDKQIKVFYGLEQRDRNEPIPYHGVWRKPKIEAQQAAPSNR